MIKYILFLYSSFTFAAVSQLGAIDEEKVNKSLADPFSVPVSDFSRNLSVSIARNFTLIPEFSGENTSYDQVYGERASTGFFIENNWYNLKSDIVSAGFHIGSGFIIDDGGGEFERNDVVDVSGLGKANETYHFTHVPLEAGIGFTLSMFKYLVPFANINGLAMLVYEKRVNDNTEKDQHFGIGYGASYEVGLGFWMNFLERAAAWALDYHWSVNNTYLTVRYKGLYTMGKVKYDDNILNFGFTFEY